jgi:hypothetical protein
MMSDRLSEDYGEEAIAVKPELSMRNDRLSEVHFLVVIAFAPFT